MNIKTLVSLFIMLSCAFASASEPYSFTNPLSSVGASKQMPAFDVDLMLEQDANAEPGTKMRYGNLFSTDFGIDNSGEWETLESGDRIWRLLIESPGASAIKLLYDKFYLPEGTSLFIYNEDRDMVIGPFTHEDNYYDGTFGHELVKGEKLILEYYEPINVIESPELNIKTVVHDYKDILGFHETSNYCGINVACSEADPYEDQANSVIFLDMGGYICSAALINNTNNDKTPYVLTAYHCVEGSANLGQHNWFTFYFKHQGYTCSSNSGNYSYSETGSYIRSQRGMSYSDFALLEMDDTPPSNFDAYYAGWRRYTSAPTISVGIHHPGGYPKEINFDNDVAYSDGWYSGGTHWGLYWDEGGTAGGSSGSPLFDNSGRIVGQLSGGTGGDCGGYDLYGKFSSSWDGSSSTNRLKDWLDPGNTGVFTLDGTYEGGTSGCTDNSACNYDWSADYDDGSCTYPQGSCDCDGDPVGNYCNCSYDYNDACGVCDGDGTSCSEPATLSFGALGSGSFEIIIDTPEPIAGFQFNITDSPDQININDVSGGAASDADFQISFNESGTVVAFSLTGSTIPAGQHVLTNVYYSGDGTPELCLEEGFVADPNGDNVPVSYGDCITLTGSASLSFGNVFPGGVEIVLFSTDPIAGFQFDLTDSPDQLSVTGASGGSAEQYDYQVSTNQSGTTLGFTLTGTTIPAGEAVLTNLYFEGEGSPEICLSNGIVSDSSGAGMSISYGECVTAVLTMPGDTNGDGAIDILDVVILVNDLLAGGYSAVGDINGDGVLNVLDVVQLVNLILGQ